MKYDNVFIDHCRDVMTKEGFEIYMAFLGADEGDVSRSLLRGDSKEYIHGDEKQSRGDKKSRRDKK